LKNAEPPKLCPFVFKGKERVLRKIHTGPIFSRLDFIVYISGKIVYTMVWMEVV